MLLFPLPHTADLTFVSLAGGAYCCSSYFSKIGSGDWSELHDPSLFHSYHFLEGLRGTGAQSYSKRLRDHSTENDRQSAGGSAACAP